MLSFNKWKNVLVTLCLMAATSLASKAQTFETLLIFDNSDGATPVDTPLVQGTDGNLYGTTLGGGANESGTVFRLKAGKVTTLYNFCAQPNCTDGALPYGGLVLGRDGNFYGTTSQGGTDGDGTVFKITPSGTWTQLHSFNGQDGSGPAAPMILAADGNFYGITMNGGDNGNSGTVFKITHGGILTTMHSFCCGDGSFFNGPLVQGNDRNFYGTSELGGTNGQGNIFKITSNGSVSTLYSFSGSDGSSPAGGLVQASDGNFYGTTYEGGANGGCPNNCGTVFKITPSGSLTTLHSFDSTGGNLPIAGVIQATDGNFYGTTYGGGTEGWGTVYRMTPNGTVTTLHSFDGADGGQPYSPVIQATNGNVYGTATNGSGNAAYGTLFRVLAGLRRFISFISTSGKVGQTIGILGQGFAGATGVSFNGTTAQFTVHSDTFITATVPVDATTGFVKVATTDSILTSNVHFRVVP